MRVGLLSGIIMVLALAACTRPDAAPTDAALIEQLEADRIGFETVIERMAASPAIERLERRQDRSWVILPVDADPRRVAAVREFMVAHDIRSVALRRSRPPEAWFVMFEGTPAGKTYQSKTLIHGGPAQDWRLTDDTDSASEPPMPEPRVVYRSLGDDWYIRTSAY